MGDIVESRQEFIQEKAPQRTIGSDTFFVRGPFKSRFGSN